MLSLYLFCFITGGLFGLLTYIGHKALQNSAKSWHDMFCHECSISPLKQQYVLALINKFFRGECRECANTWPISSYMCSLFVAIQFAIIAWRAESSISLALLSIMTLCFTFLMLNEIYQQSFWQKEVYILSGVLAGIHLASVTHSFIPAIYILIIVCAVILFIQLCSKLFIRSACIPYNEVMMILVSSMLIPSYLLANYLFLLSVLSFLWALLLKVLRINKAIPLMPAFIIALWICLLFPSSLLVMMFNS